MQENRSLFVYSIVLFSLVTLSLLWSSISEDAVYYLGIARDIQDGLVLYKDIHSVYGPMMMYWNSLFFHFIEDFFYPVFLLFQYFLLFLSSFFLYKIAIAFFALDKRKACLLCIFFLISSLSCDGTYINLEVYVVFFVFLGFWSFFHKKYFLTGMFLGFSFFCKQYGLLHFIPFYFFLFVYEKKKTILQFSIGGLLPLFLFILYFSCYHCIDIMSLFYQLAGQNYLQGYSGPIGSYFYFFWGGKVFFLLLLPLLLSKRSLFDNKISIFLSIGIFINFLPAIVQSFQHYFLLAFPYLFLLLAATVFQPNAKKISQIALHISIIFIFSFLAIRLYRYREVSQKYIFISESIAKEIPKGSFVLLEGKIRYLYLMNRYKNPILKETGYSFSFFWKKEWANRFPILSYKKKEGWEIKKVLSIGKEILYLY